MGSDPVLSSGSPGARSSPAGGNALFDMIICTQIWSWKYMVACPESSWDRRLRVQLDISLSLTSLGSNAFGAGGRGMFA